MKREIKFRAWDWANSQMLNVAQATFDDTALPFMEKGILGLSENGSHYRIRPSEYELMQFTGLKDKNGVEIYEGDIVELCGTGSNYDGTLFEIGFRMGSFEMQNEEDLPPLSFIYLAVQLRVKNRIVRDFQAMDYIKKVGNIYENPELLTSPK